MAEDPNFIFVHKNSSFHLCQRCDTKSSESDDYSYSDDETVNDTSTRHFLPGPNGFKISGQKIQIYSDGSVTATDAGTHDHNGLPDDNIRAYSLTESESDKESEYSNYDADCSVLESPRMPAKLPEPVQIPVKPPRRRSSEKDAARIGEDIERLQLQVGLLGLEKIVKL